MRIFKTRLFTGTILTLLLSSALQAQTLHFLIVADTGDRSIGASVKNDVRNMSNKAREIATNSGMKLNLKVVQAPEFSSTSTLAAVNALTPGSNDTVFFYYSGHGYRTKESKTRWPNMYTKQPQAGVEFAKVMDILDKKNPRLLIALGDLCNSYSDQSDRSTNSRAFAELQPDNYKKLFVNFSGRVYASSSKPGQFSMAEENGGSFTLQWIQALANELRSDEPSWKKLMVSATKSIRVGDPQQPTQDPIFELKEGKTTPTGNADQYPLNENDTPQVVQNNTQVTQVQQEVEEENEEYEQDEFCGDLLNLIKNLDDLQNALKPQIRITQGDSLYNSLASVSTALQSIAEASGDNKLGKLVTRLDGSLQQQNTRSYKQNLGAVINYFKQMSNQRSCQ